MGADRMSELADTLAQAAGGEDAMHDTLEMLEELRKNGVVRPRYNLAPAYGTGLEQRRLTEDTPALTSGHEPMSGL
jgi:hypothetical protein